MYLTPFRLSALVPCFWCRHTGSFTRQWRRHRLRFSPQIFCRRQAMSEHLLLWSILRMRNMIQTDACPMKKFPPICLAQTILNFIPVRAWLVILTMLHTDHCIWPEMYFITQRKVRSHPTKKRQMDLKTGQWRKWLLPGRWRDRRHCHRLWLVWQQRTVDHWYRVYDHDRLRIWGSEKLYHNDFDKQLSIFSLNSWPRASNFLQLQTRSLKFSPAPSKKPVLPVSFLTEAAHERRAFYLPGYSPMYYLPNSAFNAVVKAGTILFRSPTRP